MLYVDKMIFELRQIIAPEANFFIVRIAVDFTAVLSEIHDAGHVLSDLFKIDDAFLRSQLPFDRIFIFACGIIVVLLNHCKDSYFIYSTICVNCQHFIEFLRKK